MQANIILKELNQKIELAIQNKLIPDDRVYNEIEFNVDKFGQGRSIEFWLSSPRYEKDHSLIEIPVHLLKYFIFKNIV
jgi:hypothetical protein